MRVPYCEVKSEALCHQKLEIENVDWCCLRDAARVGIQRYRVICRLRSQEDHGQPESLV